MTDRHDRDPKTYAIIGAAMTVHRELGCGYLEAVYHEALTMELLRAGIPFVHEADLPVLYRGVRLATVYRADFICYDEIIVELKALDVLTGREHAQVINYLRASGLRRGLLLNFGNVSLQHKRFVWG